MSEGSSILSSGSKKQYGTLKSSTSAPVTHNIHYVRPGDTLVSIAVYYGTTVQKLKWMNKLWGSDISNIESLKVPLKLKCSDSKMDISNLIELNTINKSPKMCLTQTEESVVIPPASIYLKGLTERIQKAKESASNCLEKSRLDEIMAHCNPTGLDYYRLSNHTTSINEPSVIVTTPSNNITSRNTSITTTTNNNNNFNSNFQSYSNMSFYANLSDIHDPC